ncbi:MAG: hypothetical protein WA021_01935 [Minisyncoccia bacterium]
MFETLRIGRQKWVRKHPFFSARKTVADAKTEVKQLVGRLYPGKKIPIEYNIWEDKEYSKLQIQPKA